MTIETAQTHAPYAGFAPVTPIGDAAVLSLVPPAMQGDHVVHPDPVGMDGVEQQPLPTSPEIPVAPVRHRQPVRPLISLPPGVPLSAALSVAPLLPGQLAPAFGAPQVQPLPSAYGLAPTAFPFGAAPAFSVVPPAWGMMPQAMPVQMFVAYVCLMPAPMMQPGLGLGAVPGVAPVSGFGPSFPQGFASGLAPATPATWQAPQPPQPPAF